MLHNSATPLHVEYTTYSAHSELGVAAIRHNLIVIALNMTEPMIEQALAVGGDGLLP